MKPPKAQHQMLYLNPNPKEIKTKPTQINLAQLQARTTINQKPNTTNNQLNAMLVQQQIENQTRAKHKLTRTVAK